MPELPEVETMVRGLKPAMKDRRIVELAVLDRLLLQNCIPETLSERARSAPVIGIDRRGKWVVMELGESRGVIVIQPRMTGGFWLIPPVRPEHARLKFTLEGLAEPIWFCDARRLGKIALYDDRDAAMLAFRKSQGPDALEIDREDLQERLARTSRPIKPALMDQKILAGIGNIYADETLFRARIHPERAANRLDPDEIARIHVAIHSVLAEAIAAEGSSFDAGYRTVLGLEGGFLAKNAMYGRGGKPCPGCEGPVMKTKIVGLIGRPTHYCPTCQPAEDAKPIRPKRSR